MCPSRKIINQTKNGILTFCRKSKLFQFVYNNLCFELYEWELQKFIDYLESLDADYWERQLRGTLHSRKIPITVGSNHFIILISSQELNELKRLLTAELLVTWLSYEEIANTLCYN